MAELSKHILIENVVPTVDQGKYPVKAIVGENCVVEADIFRDGHEALRAVMRWRRGEMESWTEIPMKDLGNDRWQAAFPLSVVDLYEFEIEAWTEGSDNDFDRTKTEPVFSIVVDRPKARFGSWYELFVRSQGTEPKKSGKFTDAMRRLPDIKNMGFDVIYLAPIHPIGRTARKGPNNSLNAGPNDPGSPWAIGNENGGHTAIEPSIGTLQDFDRFIDAANELEIEIAFDFAPHCSPDHPWVKEHPEWFYHRPDGTIKCHENPPYVYEDIYPLNFDCPNQNELYDALLNVFLFWIGHGIKIFRVDNPHTKPVAFWKWVIYEVKRKHPDVFFLAEAFTRPKMMKALSKAGFSQSYTYFIWRNSKQELTEYMTELIHPEMARILRPNFFVTTPDVLPPLLQSSNPAVFKMRLALAATLCPSYGIVSGFELCEGQGIPGTQEYADSEKYEIKVRDWNRPGNIKGTIMRLNQIRRDNLVFHAMDNIHLLEIKNDQLFVYLKVTPDKSNSVLIAVNLDPNNTHESSLQIPLDKIGFSWEAEFEVRELMTQTTQRWTKNIVLRIEPNQEPFQIFLVKR